MLACRVISRVATNSTTSLSECLPVQYVSLDGGVAAASHLRCFTRTA